MLLEVDHPAFEAARDLIARIAELESSPEHIHTYRITPLSLWNAAATGLDAEGVLAGLAAFSRFPVPENVAATVRELMGRYGRLRLVPHGPERLALEADDPALLGEVRRLKGLEGTIETEASGRLVLPGERRGHVKQVLLKAGYPVRDLAGHVDGRPLSLSLRKVTAAGERLELRPYQRRAVDAFLAGGGPDGGSGVVVLPCGAGKTLVGLAAMARLQQSTLILCTSNTALRQWIREILDKTTLTEGEVGEYSGLAKEVRPVTVATYSILTTTKQGTYPHFALFHAQPWGLVVYDEVHLLPAPIFRMTAEIQARRRLGLTATLVREDGREGDVFSLIGPKRYDAPWRELEGQGWIATAECTEVRVPLPEGVRERIVGAPTAEAFRLAAENPAKEAVVLELVRRHAAEGDRILVMARFLDQLERVAERLGAPVVNGRTPQRRREQLFEAFRRGELTTLAVSNVANFAIDLPEASVAVEISGTYGSRQEEAQRLGRILRPKADGRPAHFYGVVSAESPEEDFARLRQRYLTEQGYRYRILKAVPDPILAERVALEDVRLGKVIDLAQYRSGEREGRRP